MTKIGLSLLFLVLLTGGLFGQVVMDQKEKETYFQLQQKNATWSTSNVLEQPNCEINDQLKYLEAKLTSPRFYSMSVSSFYSGYAQYFDAPEELYVNGFCFFGQINEETDSGEVAFVQAMLYSIDPTDSSIQDLLATDSVSMSNFFREYCVNFDSPVLIDGPYAVAISIVDPSVNVNLVANDPDAGDGGQEGLGYFYYSEPGFIGWYPHKDFGPAWDFDWILEPKVTYTTRVNFEVDARSSCVGEEVFFENSSADFFFNRMYNRAVFVDSLPQSFTWRLAQDTIIQGVNVTHDFEIQGKTSVELTGQLMGWTAPCSMKKSIKYLVLDAPSADFDFQQIGDKVLQFTDGSTGNPNAWTWDFGDGFGVSNEQHPTYEYSLPGKYKVTLIAENACGEDQAAKTVRLASTGNEKQWTLGKRSSDFAKIYPNPSPGGQLFLEKLSEGPAQLSIWNAYGLQVATHEVKSEIQRLDLSDLPAGIYTIQWVQNGEVKSYRIAIQD